jgi:hypothetical protein
MAKNYVETRETVKKRVWAEIDFPRIQVISSAIITIFFPDKFTQIKFSFEHLKLQK